jgi:hypothetical protein
MINQQTTNNSTKITVLNYDSYQGDQPAVNQQFNQQTTSTQPTRNQPVTTDKNVNKEKNVENVKNKEVKKTVILPFSSDEFLRWWQLWKDYKKAENRFNYKSEISEQAAAKELAKLAGGNESTAIKIIEQSMAKGWKGFFALDKNSSGTRSEEERAEILRRGGEYLENKYLRKT